MLKLYYGKQVEYELKKVDGDYHIPSAYFVDSGESLNEEETEDLLYALRFDLDQIWEEMQDYLWNYQP